MAKTVKTKIKLQIPAGVASPAPPVGPALGQHGLPIMDFIRAFNDKTAELKGSLVPVVITVYEDRTFTFITKKPPVSDLIKKELGLEKGSSKSGRESAGALNEQQTVKIAKEKMDDLNTQNIEAAAKIVKGTARSMGVAVE